MYIAPVIKSLGFLPNKTEEWTNFYLVCLRIEKEHPQIFNPNHTSYCTQRELINALCYQCPYMYECKNTDLHWTEWEIRRVKCYGFID